MGNGSKPNTFLGRLRFPVAQLHNAIHGQMSLRLNARFLDLSAKSVSSADKLSRLLLCLNYVEVSSDS